MDSKTNDSSSLDVPLQDDALEHLDSLAQNLDTSVETLIQYGIVLLLVRCGEDVPESLTGVTKMPTGPAVSWLPTIEVAFGQTLHGKIEQIAASRQLTAAEFVHDHMAAVCGGPTVYPQEGTN